MNKVIVVEDIDKDVFSRVSNEYQTLIGGRKQMTMSEFYALKSYAKKRTTLDRSIDALTHEQKAWRYYHDEIEKMISDNFSEESRNTFESLDEKLATANQVKKAIDELGALGRDIEKVFVLQGAFSIFHWDKDQNEHRQNLDNLSEAMVNADLDISNEKRVKIAETIIATVDAYSEYVLNKMKEHQDSLFEKLSRFENILDTTPFDSVREILEGDNFDTRCREWLILSKELYASRVSAITAISSNLDSEKFLPTRIIELNGDVKEIMNKEETNDFFENVLTYTAHVTTSREKELEVEAKRSPLSKSIFGDPESYMDSGDKSGENMQEVVSPALTNPLQDKAWFRLAKVLYIGSYAIAILIGIAIFSDDSTIGLWTLVSVYLLFMFLKKGFYYVVLGKTSWK